MAIRANNNGNPEMKYMSRDRSWWNGFLLGLRSDCAYLVLCKQKVIMLKFPYGAVTVGNRAAYKGAFLK